MQGLRKKFCAEKKVHTYWFHGHWGVERDEIADELAKRGYNLPGRMTLDVLVPLRSLKLDVDSTRSSMADAVWRNTETCRVLKIMDRSNDPRSTEHLLSLSRATIHFWFGY